MNISLIIIVQEEKKTMRWREACKSLYPTCRDLRKSEDTTWREGT